jgi:hypothetical protein
MHPGAGQGHRSVMARSCRSDDRACSSSSSALLSVNATHANRLTPRRRTARSTRAVGGNDLA